MRHALVVAPALLPLCAQAAVLVVEKPAGLTVARGEQSIPAHDQDAFDASDLLVTTEQGHALLRVGHYGTVEIGASARLMVERMPFSSYASDLSTQFSLDAGDLRLVWKYPALSAPWPMAMRVGPVLATVSSGEYFLSASATPLLCVQDGQAVVQMNGQLLPKRLRGPACYRLGGSDAPVAEAHPEADFIAMREGLARGAAHAVADLAGAPPVPNVPYAVAHGKQRPLAAEAEASAARPRASAPPLAAETQPVPPTYASGNWVVVATSEETESAAQREAARLQGAGYYTQVETAQVRGRTWHRVLVQAGSSEREARALAGEITQKLRYPDPWVRRL